MTAEGPNRVATLRSPHVRAALIRALRLDLVGPAPEDELAEEQLPGWVRPSNWYLTGFLVPTEAPSGQRGDPAEGDELEELPESAGLAEESAEDRKAAKKAFFPSSLGLSFLVSEGTSSVAVSVRWGDYTAGEIEGKDGKMVRVWMRTPREAVVALDLKNSGKPEAYAVPESDGLELNVLVRPVPAENVDGQLPLGTRSVAVFLVNGREPSDSPDEAFAFQPELEIRADAPFVPRPDLRGAGAADWDEQVADLHYAGRPEYAAGHGISATWDLLDGQCQVLRTVWLPTAEVERTETVPVPGVELSMSALGTIADGEAARQALEPLVARYRAWVGEERARHASLEGDRKETAEELLRQCGLAADRIEQGIATLANDPQALDAFRVANRAVGRALQRRLDIEEPAWRAFQLAFILLNLPGLADPADPHRETVDLLFFPTGGGKTEAYLGLAAFAMVLRRLRATDSDDGTLAGSGVSVIMRYTLRLLTLDQLSRAAGLVCALELERGEDPERYGEWPFEIGLWVGKAATPNEMGKKGDKSTTSARVKTIHFKSNPRGNPSPIPLENCPWCGSKFEAGSFTLLPNGDEPRELRVVCADFECDFTRDRPLPIVAVDEPLYRRLPSFLIATVDKFAALPWVGRSGVLLGGADRYADAGFYGPAEPELGKRLSAPLAPPDLVIQDELHLISGPLGTMAGLYETAIAGLSKSEVNGRPVRPKVVASTATVRRAPDQIQALFARPLTAVFPPPGPDVRHTFFVETKKPEDSPARLYLGVAAQGRNPKVLLQRTWRALMGAAERAYREAGGHQNRENPADPYMTVLCYFNSLRELGGCRRILEEQVQNTIKGYGTRKRLNEDSGLFMNRTTFSEVVELTSRVPTNKVAEARRRLEAEFYERDRVDCAIATNMISVGMDIQRLGLMVVMGQPKTHAEYIQATSRVGRDAERPGLVVTLLNIHKPRDRSHYERFRHYHETFYRSVEVTSVTPFAARALDRGFAGALVGLARHLRPPLTPPQGAELIGEERAALEELLLGTFLARVREQPIDDPAELEERLRTVDARVVDLLDSWRKVLDDYQQVGTALQYQQYEDTVPKPLLREMLDQQFESEHHRKFRANRSLRDVEPEVNLLLQDLGGAPGGGA